MKRLKRQQTMRYNAPKDQLLWYQKIWMTLDDPGFSTASFWYAQFSLAIIVIATVSFCLETELNCNEHIKHEHADLFKGSSCEDWENMWWHLECIMVILFTVELVLRGATARRSR